MTAAVTPPPLLTALMSPSKDSTVGGEPQATHPPPPTHSTNVAVKGQHSRRGAPGQSAVEVGGHAGVGHGVSEHHLRGGGAGGSGFSPPSEAILWGGPYGPEGAGREGGVFGDGGLIIRV